MATDIPGVISDPACSTRDNENRKFAENANGKLVVRVEDEAAGTLLSQILIAVGGTTGTPFYSDVQTISTPGVTQTLVSFNVPALTTRTLLSVVMVCRSSAKFEVQLSGGVIASGRTGAARQNSQFIWSPGRDALTGELVEIKFTQVSGTPAQDVECYLMALDN